MGTHLIRNEDSRVQLPVLALFSVSWTMSCPLCKNGPGDFVVGMMLGHAWSRVTIPDLPNLNLESSEVQKLLGHLVWHATNDICLHDFAVGSVIVRETGITGTPENDEKNVDQRALREFYELRGMLGTPNEIPLPEGVWVALKQLNDK